MSCIRVQSPGAKLCCKQAPLAPSGRDYHSGHHQCSTPSGPAFSFTRPKGKPSGLIVTYESPGAPCSYVCVQTDYSVYSAGILLLPPPLINSVGVKTAQGLGCRGLREENNSTRKKQDQLWECAWMMHVSDLNHCLCFSVNKWYKSLPLQGRRLEVKHNLHSS